ncbi:kynureninase [Spizellomyces sp. 'palustris']|nr:kynureninase [Spizellomyces sp. 'palustris']
MYPRQMSLHLTGRKYYEVLSRELEVPLDSSEFASIMDGRDPLKHFRAKFAIPKQKDVLSHEVNNTDPEESAIYFCGNSLGLQPLGTRKLVDEELDVWARSGVVGHFKHSHDRPWVSIDDHVIEASGRIVGAKKEEVAIMNSLTVNLHFLMMSFYRPSNDRYKILIEEHAFPSDYYAVESQVRFHGYDPTDAIIQLGPRTGEHTIQTEDILECIARNGDQIALVLFSGVQYYTGQFFELEKIAVAARKKGCVVGFDLAHAVGNVPLRLHDWGVDFACWCTYKYLNAGPGGIGGAFVHEKHAVSDLPRLTGWWGTDPTKKFLMDNVFRPIQGANVYRVSNPNVLATVSLLGSLQVFSRTSMEDLRAKSVLLTGYLEALLEGIPGFTILTPADPAQRGCQLSLLFRPGLMLKVLEELEKKGVVVDERKPDVIRVAPTPLYNTFTEVHRFVEILRIALEKCQETNAGCVETSSSPTS